MVRNAVNEKFKLLALQAQMGTADFDAGSYYVATPDRMQRFAELIVRECRDIVEQDMKLAHIQMIPLTLEKYANGRLKEKISEHFGVEE